MPLQPRARLGPYEIQSPLGAGGMGEVYKARDTRLDRTVAIKILPETLAADPQFRERFDREARTISQLDHPHICALYDVGEQHGMAYLVMQYLEGETLAERLAGRPVSVDEALTIAIQIASALDKAHRAGVVHRDLKPGNIMLTKAGAKLLDFGLAKATGVAQNFSSAVPGRSKDLRHIETMPTMTSPNLTAQGMILGTFQYMAPEQLEGQEADARTDIFAFGAVLYEMLTGKKAFEGKSHASLIGAILKDEPPPISQVQPIAPRALDRVVQTCLAKDPDDRWQTARDLLRELRWASEPGPTVAPVPSRTRRVTRERAYGVSALVFLLTSLALTAWTILKPTPTPAPIRFSVAAPERGSINTFALSPDGRVLVFSATPPSTAPADLGTVRAEQSTLHVRPINATSTQALPGTEGARSPFWSPDSRFIGFFANGKLKMVDASGGVVRTICDAPGQRFGGDWNRDGVILFATENVNPIQRVSASGGQPSLVTSVTGRNGHLFPSFLPDGRYFLYSEQGVGIRRRSLDSNDDVVLIKTSAPGWAKYVSPGYLVYVRGSELVAQPFDAARASFSGDPVTVGNVGAYGDTVNGFSVANDGVLAVQTRERMLTQLVWFDRSGERLSTVGQPGYYKNPQLSPDGSRVAVNETEADRDTTRVVDVWVVELTRGVKTRLTFDSTHGDNFVWSPDGAYVVFRSSGPSVPPGIFRLLASGSGGEEQLTAARGDPNSYSADGKYIVYTILNADTNRDLGVLPLVGDRKPFLFAHTRFNETQGQISPDGKWVAYASDEAGSRSSTSRPFRLAGEKRASPRRVAFSRDGAETAASCSSCRAAAS